MVEFDYVLQYKSGKANVVTDALSRWMEFVLISIHGPWINLLNHIKEGIQ